MPKKYSDQILESKLSQGWKNFSWKRKINFLKQIQEKIYLSALRGDIHLMNRLQKTVSSSLTIKLLAIKFVTEQYQIYLKNITKIKLALLLNIHQNIDLYPYWEKNKLDINYTEFRHIYIQSVYLIIRFILEPQWEAYLEPNTFGGRPYYNERDAALALLREIKKNKYYYAVSGYLTCNLDKKQKYILSNKLHNSTYLLKILNPYLNNEIHEPYLYNTNKVSGKEQVNSLLFNILIHGLKYHIIENILSRTRADYSNTFSVCYISYQQCFYVLCEKQFIHQWLTEILVKNFKSLHIYFSHSVFSLNPLYCELSFLGFLFQINSYYINIVPDIQSQKDLIYQIRQVLYKKDFLGRTRALTHLTLEESISKINPILSYWAQYYSICTKTKYFYLIDTIVDNTIYRWQIKKYKRKTLENWKKQCIRYINNRKRIAQGNAILRLLQIETSQKNCYIGLQHYRSKYDQDYNYWFYRRIQ